MKIKIKELARKLTNNKLKEIYGDEAVFEDNFDEFYGRKYRKGVIDDADLLFNFFLQEIKDHIEYPFKEGDKYYTIIRSDKRYDIQESVWDDVSEEMYRSYPDTKFFKKESQAYNHISQLKNEEQINLLKNGKTNR